MLTAVLPSSVHSRSVGLQRKSSQKGRDSYFIGKLYDLGTERFQSSCSFLLPRILLSAPSAHCPCTLHGQATGLSCPLYPFTYIWLNPTYLSGPTSNVPTWPPAPIFQPETVSPPWFPMAGPAGKTSLRLSQGWYLFPSNAPVFS